MTFCPSGMAYGDACKYPTFSCVSGTTYGKTCTVLCPAGYELKNGARIITCEASGAWTTYSGNYCSRINKPPTKVKNRVKRNLIFKLEFVFSFSFRCISRELRFSRTSRRDTLSARLRVRTPIRTTLTRIDSWTATTAGSKSSTEAAYQSRSVPTTKHRRKGF